MASASLLSITLVPVMMGLFIRRGVKPESANPVNRLLIRVYRPVIEFVLRHRWLTIVAEANHTVKTPGVGNMWSMPIKNRLDMLTTGIKTPVGIKLFGPSLDTLDMIGKRIEGLLPAVRGTNTAFAERAVGGKYLDITVDRDAAARYGLTTGDVQSSIATAAGGMEAGQVIEGRA